MAGIERGGQQCSVQQARTGVEPLPGAGYRWWATRPRRGLWTAWPSTVVMSDRAQLGEIVRRVRDGRLRTNIGRIATLDDAVAAFNPTERIRGQTIIRVRP